MRILLVESHEIFREGLIKILGNQPGFEIIGSANDFKEIYSNEIISKAELVLFSTEFIGKNELEFIRDLVFKLPKLKILVMSEQLSERFAVSSIKAGASGFISKKTMSTELVDAIKKVSSGQKYVEPYLSIINSSWRTDEIGSLLYNKLSDRELEVMILLAKGYKISKIAGDLSLSINTISTYKKRILEKLEMNSTADIIKYVIEHKLN